MSFVPATLGKGDVAELLFHAKNLSLLWVFRLTHYWDNLHLAYSQKVEAVVILRIGLSMHMWWN